MKLSKLHAIRQSHFGCSLTVATRKASVSRGLIPSLRRDGISLFAATALFRKMEDLLLAMREMET